MTDAAVTSLLPTILIKVHVPPVSLVAAVRIDLSSECFGLGNIDYRTPFSP